MDKHKQLVERTRMGIGLAVLYLALPLFLMNTNPDHLPLPLLLVPFLLSFAVLFVTIYLLGSRTRLLRGIGRRKQYALTGLLAAIPVLLLVFASMRQLTLRDLIIGVGLVVATSFYVSRADFLR